MCHLTITMIDPLCQQLSHYTDHLISLTMEYHLTITITNTIYLTISLPLKKKVDTIINHNQPYTISVLPSVNLQSSGESTVEAQLLGMVMFHS